MKVTVIIVSDRASSGEYKDLSGEIIEKILRENFKNIEINRIIIPDEEAEILESLEKSLSSDFIFTTGGTGLSERDITPDVCEKFCEKPVPGISEILRAESYKETHFAMLSRGYAGLKNKTLIVNFPGSPKAADLCTRLVIPIMPHALQILRNEISG